MTSGSRSRGPPRRAVGDDGKAQRVIKTVHARGYQFVADVRADAGRIRRAVPRLRNAPIGRDGDIGLSPSVLGATGITMNLVRRNKRKTRRAAEVEPYTT
jgi:hypothetical protein